LKKLNLLKSLIVIFSVLFSTGKAFCEATAVQTASTVVQPTVAVQKLSSVESGSINPSSGEASVLTSSFKLQSNDEETFFVVYGTLIIEDGTTVSAFDSKGNLLFGNVDNPPKEVAVSCAKLGNPKSENVIAYKVNLSGESVDIKYVESPIYKDCYKITLTNSATSGTLQQSVGGAPTQNSYTLGSDMSGNYSAVVYVTATSKL